MSQNNTSPGIHLKNITKTFGSVNVLSNITIQMKQGEFVVVVGPSGCGKSTLLRIIAGLETPTSGEIFINNKNVNTVLASKRDIAMVFQDYALYPQMSVWKNIDFCLSMKKTGREERENRVKNVIGILRLQGLEKRKPASLSGGQKQRVALARAIVRDPALFLFDEPLSNLDARLRLQTREEILSVHRRAGKCSLYVTHDQSEAMTMADRIIVLKNGVIQQQGTPQEIYRKPVNTFVAGFFGIPVMNFLPAEKGNNHSIQVVKAVINGLTVPESRKKALLGIRPEDLYLQEKGHLTGMVETVEFLGDHYTIAVRLNDHTVWCKAAEPPFVPTTGDHISLVFNAEAVHWFDYSTKERIN